jgi:hypothetical protein
MDAIENLRKLEMRLRNAEALAQAPNVKASLEALIEASKEVGKSFSAPWLGYHSRVYHRGLRLHTVRGAAGC